MILPRYDRIFGINDERSFIDEADSIFRYQSENNAVLKNFIDKLGRKPSGPAWFDKLVFLPVSMFRYHRVLSGNNEPVMVFSSSGTTGTATSKHYVTDLSVYNESFSRSFTMNYGDPSDYVILALLPSYLEREGSSLVYMTDKLISSGRNSESGFYRDDIPGMLAALTKARERGKKILLIGVSFALLDLAENYAPDLSGVTVMETGGMKGRRKEITRDEMHKQLCASFNAGSIHSEYGMTELLSQAWSEKEGRFFTPPWMRIVLRDIHDPLSLFVEPGRTGAINIVDLANINSCSFIATDDIGKINADGSFEVLGRLDYSDIRGCNLLIS